MLRNRLLKVRSSARNGLKPFRTEFRSILAMRLRIKRHVFRFRIPQPLPAGRQANSAIKSQPYQQTMLTSFLGTRMTRLIALPPINF